MPTTLLQQYVKKFAKLKVSRSRGVAPHKPILLLSVLERIEHQDIVSEEIKITPELIGNFMKNWARLVTTDHSVNFALPFYHLKSDGFWQLIPNPGYEASLSIQIKSLRNLNEAVACAQLRPELFELLTISENRKILRSVLLNTYFSQSKDRYTEHGTEEYIRIVEDKLLHETLAQYQSRFDQLDEEEIFIRGSFFKRWVPQIYDYTCCISGLRIITDDNISMIDACHIVPFSESHNDMISNGISLCPNLHRAFDRGLIAFNDHYEVVVSPAFVEQPSNYSISQFEGKRILLPKDMKYSPDLKNFKWHWENRFKK